MRAEVGVDVVVSVVVPNCYGLRVVLETDELLLEEDGLGVVADEEDGLGVVADEEEGLGVVVDEEELVEELIIWIENKLLEVV
jgi:hypothetical protein